MDKDQIKVLGMLIASFCLSIILVNAIHDHQDSFAYEVCAEAFYNNQGSKNLCEYAIKRRGHEWVGPILTGMLLAMPISVFLIKKISKD